MPSWTRWRLSPIGVRSGAWKGHTGKRIRNVDQYRHRRLRSRPGHGLRGAAGTTASATMTFRFVSNVDGTDFAEAVHDLDPAETLFIISSKTFTTLETMTNAHTARDWLLAGLKGEQAAIGQAFRRRFDQCRGGGEVRHRHGQHVRLLGLGRRALFDGFGHRPLDHARHRAGQFPRHAGRASTRWTSISAPRPSSATCRC